VHETHFRKADIWSLNSTPYVERVIEEKKAGRVEVTGRRGRSKQLLDRLKEKRGYRKFKAEALDRRQ